MALREPFDYLGGKCKNYQSGIFIIGGRNAWQKNLATY